MATGRGGWHELSLKAVVASSVVGWGLGPRSKNAVGVTEAEAVATGKKSVGLWMPVMATLFS